MYTNVDWAKTKATAIVDHYVAVRFSDASGIAHVLASAKPENALVADIAEALVERERARLEEIHAMLRCKKADEHDLHACITTSVRELLDALSDARQREAILDEHANPEAHLR